MRWKRLTRVGLFMMLAVSFGCRTDKQILDDYEAFVSRGAYDTAGVEVAEKAEEGGNSQQMWRLLAASANYMADDKVAAIAQFDKAEEVFIQNDQRSVFSRGGEGAWAMLTNDKAFEYDGGGLDREFTCLYRSIDFMSSGQRDYARVELNRLTQYQTNWLYDREKDIVAARDRMEKDAAAYEAKQNSKSTNRGATVDRALANASFANQLKAKCGYDPATSGSLTQLSMTDYMNIYGLHLTGLFRWLNGDSDRNELRDASIYAPNNSVVQRDFAECRAGRPPRNQVWVYVEDGLCPCREEWRLDLPLIFVPGANRYAPYVGMALPYLRAREPAAGSWSVEGSSGVKPMEQLEDVDRLVKVEYDVYMRGALAREITRTVVKAGAEIALGVLYDNTKDENKRLAYRWTQYAIAAWSAATTGADLRSWTALPKKVYVHRLDRPADGHVKILGNGHVEVDVTVPAGNTIVFVRKPATGAVPVVKTATF